MINMKTSRKKSATTISSGFILLSTTVLIFAFGIIISANSQLNFVYTEDIIFNLGLAATIVILILQIFITYSLTTISDDSFSKKDSPKKQLIFKIIFLIWILNIISISMIFHPLNLNFGQFELTVQTIILGGSCLSFIIYLIIHSLLHKKRQNENSTV